MTTSLLLIIQQAIAYLQPGPIQEIQCSGNIVIITLTTGEVLTYDAFKHVLDHDLTIRPANPTTQRISL